jgi:hypothetical protein
VEALARGTRPPTEALILLRPASKTVLLAASQALLWATCPSFRVLVWWIARLQGTHLIIASAMLLSHNLQQTCPMALDSRKDDNMQLFWGTIAAVCAAAIVGGVVYMIRGELREHRKRQAMKRLNWVQRDVARQAADYSRFNQDQLLRNRSERWD